MKFYLIVAKGKKQGMPIPIEIDLFMIGSGKICQLRAVHDQIGDQHCALVKRERKVFIRDMDSGHPTMVNGEIIPTGEEWPMHAGDLIEVGPLRFMIQFREKALSQRDLEEWALKCLDVDGEKRAPAVEQLESLASFTKESEGASSVASAILDRMAAKKGVVKGRLRISRDGALTIVRINDIYLVEESELAIIKKELHDNLARNNLRVLIDMKNVKRMSTAAAEMFGEIKTWLKSQGSRMAICRMKSELQGMIVSFPNLEGVKFYPDKQVAMTANW
jgi:hypothetical protein